MPPTFVFVCCLCGFEHPAEVKSYVFWDSRPICRDVSACARRFLTCAPRS